jgi:hypothetical protein
MSQCPKCGLQIGLHHSILPGCTCTTAAPFSYPVQTAPEQFMTQGELALRWKISEATLERDRSFKKGVRYMKLGGLIRYRLQDVIDYENACTHEPEVKNGG